MGRGLCPRRLGTATMMGLFRRKSRSAPLDSPSGLLWHIDHPTPGARVGGGWLLVQGWVAVRGGAALSGLFLQLGDVRVTPRAEARPDVAGLYPKRRIAGFREFVRLPEPEAEDECTLVVTVRGRQRRIPLPISVMPQPPLRDSALPFHLHLDSPRSGLEPAYHSVLVRGWIVAPLEATLEEVLVDCGTRIAIDDEKRPDVEAAYPHDQVIGFRKLISLTPSTSEEPWSLGVTLDGREYVAPLPISIPPGARDEFFRRKRGKLEKIGPILRCSRPRDDPSNLRACGGKLERVGAEGLTCIQCSQQYPVTERGFNFLSNELREISGIRDTENVSSLPYGDWELPDLIAEYADGLILDCGSGLRDVYYENVVNFEIVDYATTDVLGVGEYLPFADESFDAVISIAVLEHVRDPFACASEITRVVRPGGKIFVEVPFLQPYHGYPHHYYNMTGSGLENLFSEQFLIERSGVPPGGQPIWTLPWLLNSYVAGLPPEAAEHFKQLTVRDLLAEGSTFLDEDFVRDLDPDMAEVLAHVTYLIARKR